MSNRFFTAFDIPDVISIVCCAGDKVEPIHSLAYDENGVPFLKEVGKRDVVAEINSYKDECDINRILMRYVNGDVTALGDFGGGFYGDFADAPKSLIDVYNVVDGARNIFEGLDPDIKGKYDTFDDFLRVFGDSALLGDFLGQIGQEEVKEELNNERTE